MRQDSEVSEDVAAAPSPTASAHAAPVRPATPGTPSELRKYYGQIIAWEDCDDGIECATFDVPLSYLDLEAGSDLRLDVFRLPAGESTERRGSLVLHTAGFGDRVSYAAAWLREPLLDHFDIVGFNPRGVGGSHGVSCLASYKLDAYLDLDDSPETPAERTALQGGVKSMSAACDEFAGEEFLGAMTHENTARDLDILRHLLGDDELTMLTRSTSSTLGVTYASLFPARVGRVALDSPELHGQSALTYATGEAKAFAEGLSAYLDYCVDYLDCHLGDTVSEARKRLRSLLDGLDRKPIKGEGDRQLTASLAVTAIRLELGTVSWDRLDKELGAALDGNGETLLRRADEANGRDKMGAYTTYLDAHLALRCLDRTGLGAADAAAFTAQLTKASPIAGPALARDYLPCLTWPTPPAKPQPYPPKATPSPTVKPIAAPTASPTKSAAPAPFSAVALKTYYDQKLTWRKCGDAGLECTFLTVPFSYHKPGADSDLELEIYRSAASKKTRRLGSLVVVRDGHGDDIGDLDQFGKQVPSRFDLIGFYQRGFENSRGLTCLRGPEMVRYLAGDDTPTTAAEWTTLRQRTKGLADACDNAVLGDFLQTMTHEYAARDLDILRAALGEEKLRLLARSSASTVGVAYSAIFPTRVGRMVLDAPEAPLGSALDHTAPQALAFEVGLEAYFTYCVEEGNCRLGASMKHARRNLTKLLDRLEAKPIKGEGDRLLTRSLAVTGIRHGVQLFWWDEINDDIGGALEGRGAGLLGWADEANGRRDRGDYDTHLEAQLASRCLSWNGLGVAKPADLTAALRKISPIVGPVLASGYLPCLDWSVPPAVSVRFPPQTKTAPILVVGATSDLVVPYPVVKRLADQLPSGVLLTRDGPGHPAYAMGDDCVDKAVDAYLIKGTVLGNRKCG